MDCRDHAGVRLTKLPCKSLLRIQVDLLVLAPQVFIYPVLVLRLHIPANLPARVGHIELVSNAAEQCEIVRFTSYHKGVPRSGQRPGLQQACSPPTQGWTRQGSLAAVVSLERRALCRIDMIMVTNASS
eukprot:scaffold6036_cov371-Prasinococcus_capsulatus_cf.AAC.4